jgi:hypothetical protein
MLLIEYAARGFSAVNTATKTSVTFGMSLLDGAFKTFVLMLMWNWFVSPVFHTGELSFWQTFGLLLVVQLFTGGQYTENPVQTMRWLNLFSIVQACVPEHKNEGVREELKERTEGLWGEIGISMFSQLAGYALTLGLGWLIHTFLV